MNPGCQVCQPAITIGLGYTVQIAAGSENPAPVTIDVTASTMQACICEVDCGSPMCWRKMYYPSTYQFQ